MLDVLEVNAGEQIEPIADRRLRGSMDVKFMSRVKEDMIRADVREEDAGR